jgi:hypothetical protein
MEETMRKYAAALVAMVVALVLAVPATASVAKVSGIRADVTCHDPCDDPFQLKARVGGSNVGGLLVTFSVKGHTFRALTSDSGYAHYHLHMRPSDYPQGVVVKVTATVTHGGVTKSVTTWFKPNYN